MGIFEGFFSCRIVKGVCSVYSGTSFVSSASYSGLLVSAMAKDCLDNRKFQCAKSRMLKTCIKLTFVLCTLSDVFPDFQELGGHS